MADQDLQLQEKKAVQTSAESTRNVPIFVPPVDIFESKTELTLLADMPGVPLENVDIDLDGETLTIRGAVPQQNGAGRTLLSEYAVGDYYRQFTVSNAIDREKIQASMRDGVLKLVLPKAEAVLPRKIEVRNS